jgi:glycosyltransferase involved in cell wall biosynthesis
VFLPCAIIPVYNHEHAIAAVVGSVRAQGLPVLLVDDGSSAACAAELERLSAQPSVSLTKHATNRGKGAAVLTGFRVAGEQGFTHVLQVDADGQHTLSDVRRFVDEARDYPQAVICGRPVFDASIPRVRYYGRYLTHALVWLETLSFDIIDSMCGFRMYPLEPVRELLARKRVGSRMDFDTEILVNLHWMGVPMRWIATRVSYPLNGVSHFRMFRDNLLMIALHARLVSGMLLRWPSILSRKFARRDLLRAQKHNADGRGR